MPTDVIMPQMGESIFEGTITKWLKKAGDTVEKDEPLFEISTDKVDAEIPSPAAGVLTEIKVPEGATVEVNTVVAVIGRAGDGSDRNRAGQAPAAADRAVAQPQPQRRMPQAGGRRAEGAAGRHAFAPRRWCGASPKRTTSTWARSRAPARTGRISKEDVLRHLSEHGPRAPQPPHRRPQLRSRPHQHWPGRWSR